MTNNHILITSDGELAVPFDAPPIEHDPGRHLTTAMQPAGDLALIPVAGSIAIGLLFREDVGYFIGLAGLVIGVITMLAFRSLKIEVYETGMKISGWNRRTYWIWWDEITEIKHLKENRWMGGLDNIGNTYLELSLYVRDKLVFTLPHSITERYDLYHVIVRHVENSLLEYYSRILPEGKAIAMGPIRIEMAGVHVHDDFLRWEDIESFERDKDVFTLRTSQQTYRLTFKRNQNVLQHLFMNAMAGETNTDPTPDILNYGKGYGRHIKTARDTHGLLLFPWTYGAPFLGIGLIAESLYWTPIVITVVVLIITYFWRGPLYRIEIYENGLLEKGLLRRRSIYWDEITAIEYRPRRIRRKLNRIQILPLELNLYTADEHRFGLQDTIFRRRRICHTIISLVENQLHGRYEAMPDSDRTLEVKDTSQTVGGLVIDDTFVAWNDIQFIRRNGNRVFIETANKQFKAIVKENQLVIERLVGE